MNAKTLSWHCGSSIHCLSSGMSWFRREYSIVCVSHSLAARPNGLDQLLTYSRSVINILESIFSFFLFNPVVRSSYKTPVFKVEKKQFLRLYTCLGHFNWSEKGCRRWDRGWRFYRKMLFRVLVSPLRGSSPFFEYWWFSTFILKQPSDGNIKGLGIQ